MLFSLRALSIALLAFLLLDPILSFVRARRVPPRVPILVDASLSMSIPFPDSTAPADAPQPSRADRLVAELERDGGRLLEEIGRDARIETMRFGERPARIAWVDPREEARPTDDRTDLARALADADVQQPGDEEDDDRRRDVEQDRDAQDARGRLEESVNRGIRREERRPIPVREPVRQRDPEPREQRREIAAPGNRDGNVADGVLQNQVPADHPRDQLAERGVRIGIRAPRLRDHGRQLCIAERRQTAHDAEQDEREDQRRPGAVANHVPVGMNLARGGGADGREDAGADHRADREEDQIPGAERALQPSRMLGLDGQVADEVGGGDGLPREE